MLLLIIFIFPHLLLQLSTMTEGAVPHQFPFGYIDCRSPKYLQSWGHVQCGMECQSGPKKVPDQPKYTSRKDTKHSLDASHHSNDSILRYDILICTSSPLSSTGHGHHTGKQQKMTRNNKWVDLGEIDSLTSNYSTVIFQDLDHLTLVARGRAVAHRKTWRFLDVKRMTFLHPTETISINHPSPYDAFFAPEHSMVIERTKVIFASGATLNLGSLRMTDVTVKGFGLGFSQSIKNISIEKTYFVDVSCSVTPSARPEVNLLDNADVTIANSNMESFTNCGRQHQLKMRSLSFLHVKISNLGFRAFSSLTVARLKFENCQIREISRHAFKGVTVTESFGFISNDVQDHLASNAFDELVIAGNEMQTLDSPSGIIVHESARNAITTVRGNSITCECSALLPSSTSSPQQRTSAGRSLYILLLKVATCMMAHDQNDTATSNSMKQSPQSFLCASCQISTDIKQKLLCQNVHPGPLPSGKLPSAGEGYSTNETLICSCDAGAIKGGQLSSTHALDDEMPKLECKDGNQGPLIPLEHYQQQHCQSQSSPALATTLPILAVLIFVGVIAGANIICYMKYVKRREIRRRESARTAVVSLEDPSDDADEHYANADSLFSQSARHTQPAAANPADSSLVNIYEQIQEDEERDVTQLVQTAAETDPSRMYLPVAEEGNGQVVAYHVISPAASARMGSNGDLHQYVDITAARMSDHVYESASVHESSEIYAVPADNNEESEGDYEEVAPTNRRAAIESLAPTQTDQEEQEGASHPHYDVPHWTGPIPAVIRQL